MIAEIGHNHQGDRAKALQMIEAAAWAGADAVKFQKRNNKKVFTKAAYNRPYDHRDSFGDTYGAHREKLEFDWEDYVALKACAQKKGVEFMCTPFDEESIDLLEKLGVTAYKFASGELTNTPLLIYAAKLGKPIIVSTGAATLEEIGIAGDGGLHGGSIRIN